LENTNAPAADPARDWPPRFFERAVLESYRAALWPAAPLAAAWMAASARRRPQLARFRPVVPSFNRGPLWVHACSVGEVTTAIPMLRALLERWSGMPVLLTASTPAGLALARREAPAPVAWFPLDHPLSVRGFFTRLRPRGLVLVETELWPAVLASAHARRVPVVLVSGRLSDRRARSYRRMAALWRPVVRPIAAAAMQTPVFAERMAALGLDRARIAVTGNIKYDAAPAACTPEERAALRGSLGIAEAAPVLVFGSTRPGDEALAARCWASLSARFPGLRMIVAPRHLDRIGEVRAAFSGVPHVLRSTLAEGAAPGGAPVVLLDTHGELRRVYSVATVAVVCGSFYPGVNGHNPIEPAAQGVAAVFGPHMRNFEDIAAPLIERSGAVQTRSPEELPGTLTALLEDGPRRARIGAAALEVVRLNQGAIARTLDFIAPVIEKAGARAD
jgi:3-deoxy-D-manno-octulosonic-acid transferase